MKASIIAAILIGSMLPSAVAEPTVEELSQRVTQLEKHVEGLGKALAFMAEEPALKVAVPSKPDDVAAAEPEVIVNIRADGTIHVSGKKFSLEELKAEMAKLSEENKDRPVRIRGDAAVEYTRVIEVIDACQKAGLQGISFATKRPIAQEAGVGSCEDKLGGVADVVPDLESEFFETSETSRQPWIIEGADGSLEDTMGGTIEADDLLLLEQTANCLSTHQGEHAMESCDAVKTGNGLELGISGGAPAYMSSLTVTIDAKGQFECRFNAAYPSPSAAPRWKVTKKAMKLKTAVGEPGSRLRGWISVEFDEIDDTTGEARSYEIEGYFKPVIQSSPAAEPEEDK